MDVNSLYSVSGVLEESSANSEHNGEEGLTRYIPGHFPVDNAWPDMQSCPEGRET